MKVTALKAQVKNPERVSVYVDNAYAFSFNHVQLLEQRLHVGLEVDEARLATLKKISEFGKAYERALMFVMLRPRSTREVWQYGRKKQWSPEDAQAVIEKLTQKNYLNDTLFAKSWVRSRMLSNKTSRRKLEQELLQKGVASAVIGQVLTEAGFTDQDALQALIAKKQKLARYQDVQKLMRYLVGQGFSYSDVKNALAELQ